MQTVHTMFTIGVLLALSAAAPPVQTGDPGGKQIEMRVTSYGDCDPSIRAYKKVCNGITASGCKTAPGTAACGKKYPLGTIFEVPGYGQVTCWDRGGGIKDEHLDIWFPTSEEAHKWGSRRLVITVVFTPPKNILPLRGSTCTQTVIPKPAPTMTPTPAPTPPADSCNKQRLQYGKQQYVNMQC